MAEEGFKRKLAAILSADVEGYSRLMDDDEEATVRTLKSYRAAINDLVQQYRGRIVDSPGDNILAEFSSVVDAVNCAVEIQRDLAERNTELAYNRQMQFRIGVNLGDVIEDDGNIYGDGVNIAARVESLAEAGGICISGRAYDQVLNKLGLEYESLGEHQVKNISVPIRVYRVLSYPGAAAHRVVQAKETLGRRWRNIGLLAAVVVVIIGGLAYWQLYIRQPTVEPASIEKMAFTLPDKPSIAVLPFDNMTDDPKQEYFSDGITEEIISSLSKTDKLFVIARNSTFTYKGKPVKVKQVAEELGVRYVLEGSVRKSENRVRITAQLIDATKGHHLWSERYDRDLKDIFSLQDEITMKIVTALQIKLTEGEQARLWAKQYKNLDEYLKLMEATALFRKGTEESIIRMGQIGQEFVDRAPESPIGHKMLAWYNWYISIIGQTPKESMKKAFIMVQKALALDDSDPSSHALLATIYTWMRQFDKAISAGEQSITLDPNGALGHINFGSALCYAGRIDEGIDQIKQAIRLNPFPEYLYYYNLGRCYRQKGLYEEALSEFKKALQRSPGNVFTHASLASIYSLLGRQDEAEASARKVFEIKPDFSVERSSKTWPYKNQNDIKLFADTLRKAGLPEHPPLPLPDKPSIAVLAFDNLSGDPEQQYFSDGIAENIITALSKVGELFVIARNSSFTYKGKPVKVQQVGRELGVRYVLEGSVQKSGDRVRITAQLVDAKKGQHVWAERYDRELKDIFALQDQIAMKVLTAVQVVLTDGERALLKQKEPKSLEAYLKILKGREEWRCQCKEGNDLARNLAADAIALDPEYSAAYYVQSQVYFMDAWLPPLKRSVKESLELAIKNAQEAVELDSKDAIAHGWLGYLYTYPKLYEQAIVQGEKAVQFAPNSASAHFSLGTALAYDGRYSEAIKIFKKMSRLTPKNRYSAYHVHAGLAYILSGQYDFAISEYKKAVQIAPKSPFPYMMLAPAYILSGQEEEARAAAQKLLERNPEFSIGRYEKRSPIRKMDDLGRIVTAMKKAGLPD